MDSSEFRRRGREMIDYIADYLDSISQRRIMPTVKPGYLKKLLPETAPEYPENWDDIMSDVEKYIMPGITHWQHRQFHAYFPTGNSFPATLAGLLADGFGVQGFTWAACPAVTELETIMMDWLGKMIGLPDEFLYFPETSQGGGVIQGSASDVIFVTLLAARYAAIETLKKKNPSKDAGALISCLKAYCSKEAHSGIQKAAFSGYVDLRILDTDDMFQLRGSILEKAIKEDIAAGLTPFYVCATLGTTSCCSFDVVHEIGPVCKKYNVWLHVDAAYAGSSFICPEFRHHLKGVEYAMSFNFNPNKWMLVSFDCSAMWVRDRVMFIKAFVIDPLYLQHAFGGKAIDYRHWGIPLSRRFRALKLWFVIRNYGIQGLQKHIREHVRLAKKFENLVRSDDGYEIIAQVECGLVCFRLKGANSLNKKLLASINASGKMHMIPASLGNDFVIRFCVCSQHATDDDITYAWDTIKAFTNHILGSEGSEPSMAMKAEIS